VSIRKGNRSISLKVFVNHEGKVVTIGKVDLSGSITYKPLDSDDMDILRDFKKENPS
jgi:hypothetical protein